MGGLTPFGLHFLLHCRSCKDKFQDPPSNAMTSCISAYTKEGLIYQEGEVYSLTTYGEAYIERILSTPLPSFTYV